MNNDVWGWNDEREFEINYPFKSREDAVEDARRNFKNNLKSGTIRVGKLKPLDVGSHAESAIDLSGMLDFMDKTIDFSVIQDPNTGHFTCKFDKKKAENELMRVLKNWAEDQLMSFTLYMPEHEVFYI